MLFFIEIQKSYYNQSLRTKEDIYIQLVSRQYDENLLKIHAQFTLTKFPQNFQAIFRFLLMFLCKKKGKTLLISNYFIFMKRSLFIQFQIYFPIMIVN